MKLKRRYCSSISEAAVHAGFWPGISRDGHVVGLYPYDLRAILSISILIREAPYKCVAESNSSLGLPGQLNSATHATNHGNE